MPGPCRPIELSIPLGVSAIRGVGRPERGRSCTDLVTTAPIAVRSTNGSSSGRTPSSPEAVSTGLGIAADPSDVDMSTAVSTSGHGATTPIASAPTTSQGSVPTSANRTRSPPNTGPSTQDREKRVRPSSPTTGSTQVMQTPIPQAIDSSTAT